MSGKRQSSYQEGGDTKSATALVQLIRSIVRDEISKIKNYEKYRDGFVISANGGSAVVNINGVQYTVPNRSGVDLVANSRVRVFFGDKFMSDAYIGTVL